MRYVVAFVLLLALVAPADAAVRNWTGTTSGTWNVASNWGGTAPVAGDDLVFANSNFANALNNNFAAATAFNSLTWNAPVTFSPGGNSINLGAGGITQTSGTTLNSFLPLVLTAPQTWSASLPGQLILNGPASLALGSNLLTMTGNGAVSFSGNTITGTGTIALTGPTLTVTGNLNSTGPVTVAGGSHMVLATPAAIATPIVVQSGGFLDDTVGFSGFMNAPLTIASGGTYNIVINGTAILQYSKVTVNVGPITLGGTLVVTNNISAPIGTVYTIILNQTGSPVVGTFAGLPEGATFSAGGQTFQVSYQTGLAHDVTLTVINAPTLQSIAVTPANPSIAKGATQQFTATGTFSDASTQNLTSQVTWASATPAVATINSGGLATGVAAGTSSISATLSGITGSTALTVTAPSLQSITVTPANPSIAKGATQQFTATGTFSDASTQNLTSQVTWASATPAMATINSGGLATGVAAGTSTISATLSGITGSTVLTVTVGPPGTSQPIPTLNDWALALLGFALLLLARFTFRRRG